MGQEEKCGHSERNKRTTIEEQLRQRWLQWVGHLQRMPDNRPQKQVLRCQPQRGKQNPGGTGTLQRWIDLIHKDPQGSVQNPSIK